MSDIRSFFNEIEMHLMEDEKPSEFLDMAKTRPEMQEFPFVYLRRLEDV